MNLVANNYYESAITIGYIFVNLKLHYFYLLVLHNEKRYETLNITFLFLFVIYYSKIKIDVISFNFMYSFNDVVQFSFIILCYKYVYKSQSFFFQNIML